MRIGILTSGGDSPGMNAAIRTVAKVALARSHAVMGIRYGYAGLLAGDARELSLLDVDGISRLGGTILGSARSAEFATEPGRDKARRAIAQLGLDALVVIGGNGSLTGAHLLGVRDAPCRIVGLPASIDNDVGYSGLAIGADTAVNTIVEACDRISDTAQAHRRAFVVEVMGRRCGFLAMRAGLAAEADAILYSEQDVAEDDLIARLRVVLRRGFSPERNKKRVLIIKAEGVKVPTSTIVRRLQAHLDEDAPGVDIRETILGHVVRGGSPSSYDRLIAQRLGFGAAMAIEKGAHDVMMGWDVPGAHGQATADSYVRMVSLADVIEETERLLDGTSEVVQRRVALLRHAEAFIAL